MPKNFSAEVAISTAKAKQSISSLRDEVGGLDKGLLNLGKTLKSTQGDLSETAKSIASIVQSSREAAKASGDLAKAKQEEAKAQRMASDNSQRDAAAKTREKIGQQNLQTAIHNTSTALERNNQAKQRGITMSRNFAASQDAMGNSLSNTRYLLYDVGATYRTLAIGGQILSGATIAVAASYEKAFAQVIRTSGETATSAAGLRSELKQMGTEIPQSFQELAKIAQIGGQLGIATSELGSFTETVAKFQATADGVTIDQATQAFGRLQNLFNTGVNGETLNPEFFRQIGAAISYTGDNSVTSEKKILSMLDKMAAVGKQAGLSATEVTALASAMSSVGIAPELGRSAIQRVFGSFAQVAARGGPALAEMASAVRLTNEEFRNLVANDPNALMNQLLDTMQAMSSIEARSFLDRLGIKGVRDQAVITALSGSLQVFKQAQDDVNSAFVEGTYLDTSSAGIFNTLTANLQKLMTAFSNLGDSIGAGVLKPLSDLVSFITPLVQGFSELITESELMRVAIGGLLTLGSLVGVFAAVKAAQSFLMAGMVSFQHVAQQGTLQTLNLKGQTTELARTMLAMRGASAQASAQILGQTTGMKALRTAAAATDGQIKSLNATLAQNAAAASTSAAATNSVAGAQAKTTAVAAGGVAPVGKFGTAMRSAGTGARMLGNGLLTLVGGPVGAMIAGIGILSVSLINTRQEAIQTADAIADAFEVSEEAGAKAVATAIEVEESWASNPFTRGSIADHAKTIGISVEEMTSAIAGGEKEMQKLVDRAEELNGNNFDELFSVPVDQQIAAGKMVNFLNEQIAAQKRAAEEADTLGKAENALGVETDELSADFGEGGQSVDEWRNSLSKALDDVFALMNAEIGLESALRDLGEGLTKSTQFGVGDENSEANMQNLQAVLQAEAELLNQAIADQQLTAQGAADQFAAYTEQLMQELVARGVDPSQVQAMADEAIYAAQGVFNEMPVEAAPTMPVTIDAAQIQGVTQQAVNAAAAVARETEITADMDLTGADETVRMTYNTVQHIANVTGQPFNVVLQALTGQANTNIAQTGNFAGQVTSTDYTAKINADTSPALNNLTGMARFAAQVISAVSGAVANVAASAAAVADVVPGIGGGDFFRGLASTASIAGSVSSALLGTSAPQPTFDRDVGTAPVVPPVPQKTLDSFDQATSGLDNVKQGFDGMDKGAQKAGNSGKKAGNDTGKAAKGAAKDVKSAAEALEDYANRLSDAFSNIYKQTYSVQEANDAYYDQLYQITKRRNDELRQVWELTRGIRQLTEERRGEVIEAEKFERMSALAAKHGNSERAKDYANEAAKLRESAAEKQAKIDEDQREIKVLQQGRGELNGYSQAAIKNRAELRALEKATTDIIVAHARNGATTAELDALTRQLTGRFQKQVGQMGHNYRAYANVRDIASRYSGVVRSIPRSVSTKASLNDQASGKARGIKSAIGAIPSSKNVRVGLSGAGPVSRTLEALGRDRTIRYNVVVGNTGALERHMHVSGGALVAKAEGGIVPKFASGGLIPGQSPNDPKKDNLLASVDNEGLIQVRSQEYIVSEPAVDHYGTAFMDKLNKMQLPRYYMGGSPGRSASKGDGLVDLSPETLQTFVRAIQQLDIALYADAERLADTVNNGREIIAQKGGVNV